MRKMWVIASAVLMMTLGLGSASADGTPTHPPVDAGPVGSSAPAPAAPLGALSVTDYHPTPTYAKWYRPVTGVIKYLYVVSAVNQATWSSITQENRWNQYNAVNGVNIRFANVPSCANIYTGGGTCFTITSAVFGGGACGITTFGISSGYFQPPIAGDGIKMSTAGVCLGYDYATRSTYIEHELGHALGLGHDPHTNDVMCGTTSCSLGYFVPSIYNEQALMNLYKP